MSGEEGEPVAAVDRALGILEAAMEVEDDPKQIVEYVKAIETLRGMRPPVDEGGDDDGAVEYVLRRVPPRVPIGAQGSDNGIQEEIKEGDVHE